MAEFASRGVANTALGLSIGALGAQLLGGGIGNLLGNVSHNMTPNNGCGGAVAACSENMLVNRYEAAQQARIAELETEVKLRDANTYAMAQVNNLRDYVDNKFAHVEHEICNQQVYNATANATIGCLAQQVAQLQGITKMVIPNTSVCPGWGNVTITPATTTTGTGA